MFWKNRYLVEMDFKTNSMLFNQNKIKIYINSLKKKKTQITFSFKDRSGRV